MLPRVNGMLMRETGNNGCLARGPIREFSATVLCLERQIPSINTHADPIIGGVESYVI